MCEAIYFDHLAAEHALMATCSFDAQSRALNHTLAADYDELARLLRLSHAFGEVSQRELEMMLLDCRSRPV
jgi:hypothetical protein